LIFLFLNFPFDFSFQLLDLVLILLLDVSNFLQMHVVKIFVLENEFFRFSLSLLLQDSHLLLPLLSDPLPVPFKLFL
jgi:hypothetical protein